MFNVVNYYRLSNRFGRQRVPVIPGMIDYFIRFAFSCWIPHTVRVGRNLVLGYGGLAIVIHSDVEIEDDVHIDQCVTIGGSGTRVGVPKIESKVYIGAGAKILGPITIGFGSIIGANAVVTRDVPPRSLAVGVPARIVRTNIDIDTFLYHKRVAQE